MELQYYTQSNSERNSTLLYFQGINCLKILYHIGLQPLRKKGIQLYRIYWKVS